MRLSDKPRSLTGIKALITEHSHSKRRQKRPKEAGGNDWFICTGQKPWRAVYPPHRPRHWAAAQTGLNGLLTATDTSIKNGHLLKQGVTFRCQVPTPQEATEKPQTLWGKVILRLSIWRSHIKLTLSAFNLAMKPDVLVVSDLMAVYSSETILVK